MERHRLVTQRDPGRTGRRARASLSSRVPCVQTSQIRVCQQTWHGEGLSPSRRSSAAVAVTTNTHPCPGLAWPRRGGPCGRLVIPVLCSFPSGTESLFHSYLNPATLMKKGTHVSREELKWRRSSEGD